MDYRCLNKQIFEFQEYEVLPLREEDIYSIKEWRNAQMDVLRQNKILTDEDQKNYYDKIVMKSFSEDNPNIILFSYLKNKKCIGYGGLTNIDWISKRAEISFLVHPDQTTNKESYGSIFSGFLLLMKIVAFDELRFNRLFTETYDIRPLHVSILERNGFKLEGRMREHIFINNAFIDSLIHGYLKSYYAK
jgi:RimJ/RimL family protein N-acetyltransferase